MGRFRAPESVESRLRATTLTALHFEEALASALIVSVLRDATFQTLGSSSQVTSSVGFFGLTIPRVIVLDTRLFEVNLRPAAVLFIISLPLLFTIFRELIRPRHH